MILSLRLRIHPYLKGLSRRTITVRGAPRQYGSLYRSPLGSCCDSITMCTIYMATDTLLLCLFLLWTLARRRCMRNLGGDLGRRNRQRPSGSLTNSTFAAPSFDFVSCFQVKQDVSHLVSDFLQLVFDVGRLLRSRLSMRLERSYCLHKPLTNGTLVFEIFLKLFGELHRAFCSGFRLCSSFLEPLAIL